MSPLNPFSGTGNPKASDLNPLVQAINGLEERLVAIEQDHAALRGEIAKRDAGDRLVALESYIGENTKRIDDMIIRYDRVVQEVNVVAANLQKAVADLAETDEVSGWKEWKERRQ